MQSVIIYFSERMYVSRCENHRLCPKSNGSVDRQYEDHIQSCAENSTGFQICLILTQSLINARYN